MSSNLTAFVDETGTNELDADKPGVSHLFICVAVVVDEAGLAATDAAIHTMPAWYRAAHFDRLPACRI
jgi:hypothetical protein